MNSRMFPRTLNEAFHQTCDYACALERPAPRAWAIVYGLAVVVIVMAIGFWGAP